MTWWRQFFSGTVAPVAYVLGTLLLVTAVAMLLPVACSLYYGSQGDLVPLLVAAGVAFAAGLPLRSRRARGVELHPRHAIVSATVGWVVISGVSAIPFLLHGSIPDVSGAFFEMMSGYTTTGATVLQDIESVPRGLLLWRSETHFLGGMGFVTLAVLVLPHGMGGLRLFRAESSPGQVVTKEKFTSRNRDAMAYLWVIYIVLNAAQVLLLCAGGMSLFDAVCHSFGTVSTSGYSTYNASIGHFDNAYFDWVIVTFMFLGGTTFVLFYRAAKGEFRAIWGNTEFRWYLGFVGFFCLSVTAILWASGVYGLSDSLRHASFQVVSLLTTTGFSTVDYEQWPPAAQMFLYVVCFVGACAGSTTSGIKVVHYVVIWKFVVAVVKKNFFQPLAVVSVRLNRRLIDTSVVHLALCYFIVNVVLILVGGMFMALVDGMDVTSAMSSVISTLMNIGPGFGEVGPTENFGGVSAVGKWFLSFNMLVGRLEMFSALVLFYPSFWKSY